MSKVNKFLHLFNKDMTADEARYVLYSHTDGLSEEDRELLWNAYLPISNELLRVELGEVEIPISQ